MGYILAFLLGLAVGVYFAQEARDKLVELKEKLKDKLNKD